MIASNIFASKTLYHTRQNMHLFILSLAIWTAVLPWPSSTMPISSPRGAMMIQGRFSKRQTQCGDANGGGGPSGAQGDNCGHGPSAAQFYTAAHSSPASQNTPATQDEGSQPSGNGANPPAGNVADQQSGSTPNQQAQCTPGTTQWDTSCSFQYTCLYVMLWNKSNCAIATPSGAEGQNCGSGTGTAQNTGTQPSPISGTQPSPIGGTQPSPIGGASTQSNPNQQAQCDSGTTQWQTSCQFLYNCVNGQWVNPNTNQQETPSGAEGQNCGSGTGTGSGTQSGPSSQPTAGASGEGSQTSSSSGQNDTEINTGATAPGDGPRSGGTMNCNGASQQQQALNAQGGTPQDYAIATLENSGGNCNGASEVQSPNSESSVGSSSLCGPFNNNVSGDTFQSGYLEGANSHVSGRCNQFSLQ